MMQNVRVLSKNEPALLYPPQRSLADTEFILFVRPSVVRRPSSVRPSVSGLELFSLDLKNSGLNIIWVKSWMGWISVPYFIRYAHNGWSCDLKFLVFLKSIVDLESWNFLSFRGTLDKKPGFAECQCLHFFSEFYSAFIIIPDARS